MPAFDQGRRLALLGTVLFAGFFFTFGVPASESIRPPEPRLEAVVSRGRLHTVAELERELDRYRRYFEGPLYAALSGTLARLGNALGMTERRL